MIFSALLLQCRLNSINKRQSMPDDIGNSAGWKAFFILLGISQAVLGFIAVRTLNQVDVNQEISKEVQITQEKVILPRLERLEGGQP